MLSDTATARLVLALTTHAGDIERGALLSYGSEFSSTSIRNNFSQYGSPYNTYSACNQYGSSPPRVFNGDGSIYYGELTLNQFRADAIRTSSIVSWLVNDVCP